MQVESHPRKLFSGLDIAINPALTKQGCYKHFNKPVYNNPVKNELLVGFRCGTLAFLTAVS